jgi:cephalosporin-C deacetylase-like acetyl esterase
MLLVVIGITYGALIGLVGNWLLFHRMAENRRNREEPLKGIGAVFFIRYALDAASLLVFALVVKDKWAIISAAISLTVAVKVSLMMVYARKGGRFE